MTHKSKQSSGSKKDYASLYASLLEQKLPSGPRPKWDKVLENKNNYKTFDEYLKAAYLALKADLRAINKNKKTISTEDPYHDVYPSIAEFCKLRLGQILERSNQKNILDQFPNASPSVKAYCAKELKKMRQEANLRRLLNINFEVDPFISREIQSDRLN
jgi:hypothetical protein